MEEKTPEKRIKTLQKSYFDVNKIVGTNSGIDFFVFSSGCTLWKVKAQLLKEEMIANGSRLISNPRKADIIFITTCAYIKFTEQMSLNAIKWFEAHKKPGAEVIVTGCLPIINPEGLRKAFKGRIIALETKDQSWLLNVPNVAPEISRFKRIFYTFRFGGAGRLFSVFKEFLLLQPQEKDSMIHDKKFYLTVTEGCAGNCSYCGIKKVHGDLISKPINSVLLEMKEGLKKGYKNFHLLSKDIGAYGKDSGTNMIELFNTLFSQKGQFTFYIPSALNASWFIEMDQEIISLLKRFPGKLREFCISVESGSDKILKAMGRGNTDIKKLKSSLLRFKKELPGFPLTAQIIVGFPGETKKDFLKSLELIESGFFSIIILFKYSERPGTKAAKMKNKIPESVINQRVKLAKRIMKSKGIQYVS